MLPIGDEVEPLTLLNGPVSLLLTAAISSVYIVLGNSSVAVNCLTSEETMNVL